MITEFALENIFWVGLAALSASGLMWTLIRDNAQSVDAADAVLLVKRDKGVFVDIRSAADFAAGNIAQSRNIPAAELPKRTTDLDRYRDKPVILVCQQGNTAKRQVRTLTALGFSQVRVLRGGINGWLDAQLPVSGKKK